MSIRLALVQPRSHSGPDEHRNAAAAVEWLERAAAGGAELVVFPEGYPGPTNPANAFEALAPLARRARERCVHVVASRIEPAGDGRHHMALHLVDDRGEIAGSYRRTTPCGPYIYRDIPAWDFDYTEADELPVFETRLGRIGLLVCSEVYVPELARVLVLRGAEVILCPAGGAINELLESWRTVVRARAIESLVYAAACQNLYEDGEQGVAIVAAPEGVLAESTGEGLVIADLDLDRLAYLRGEDEHILFPKPYATIPGVLRWRRPELYAPLGGPR
ncbi:MAG: carbon-nitrogen hydrolase family protein [Solirubrobacteraceae bacterium]